MRALSDVHRQRNSDQRGHKSRHFCRGPYARSLATALIITVAIWTNANRAQIATMTDTLNAPRLEGA